MNKIRHERKLGSALRKAYRHYLVKANEQIDWEREKIKFELGMKLQAKDLEIKELKQELKQISKEKNKTLKECRKTIQNHWEAKLELEDRKNEFIIRANDLARMVCYLEKLIGENASALTTIKRIEHQSDKLLSNVGSLEEEHGL